MDLWPAARVEAPLVTAPKAQNPPISTAAGGEESRYMACACPWAEDWADGSRAATKIVWPKENEQKRR